MPQVSHYVQDGKRYEQAVWSDPRSGQFIKRGIVSIKDQSTGEKIQDWEDNNYNSIRHTSYRS